MSDYLIINELGGVCPVQGYGTVGGLPFYFRARHEYWCFCVAKTPDGDPISVWSERDGFYREADWGDGQFAASWMPVAEAERIIRECAEQHRLAAGGGREGK
jgi:hypothetical protein